MPVLPVSSSGRELLVPMKIAWAEAQPASPVGPQPASGRTAAELAANRGSYSKGQRMPDEQDPMTKGKYVAPDTRPARAGVPCQISRSVANQSGPFACPCHHPIRKRPQIGDSDLAHAATRCTSMLVGMSIRVRPRLGGPGSFEAVQGCRLIGYGYESDNGPLSRLQTVASCASKSSVREPPYNSRPRWPSRSHRQCLAGFSGSNAWREPVHLESAARWRPARLDAASREAGAKGTLYLIRRAHGYRASLDDPSCVGQERLKSAHERAFTATRK